MTSPFERRLSKAEAATQTTEARLFYVASDDIAADLWSTARKDGTAGGLYIMKLGQQPDMIIGTTLTDLMASVAAQSRPLHEEQ
jgi:hypothetical protein